MSFDVCVIGGGITGLSVALNVQRLIRLVNVTVIADALGKETHTPVTESLFIPAPTTVTDVEHTVARDWFADTWDHHLSLVTSPEGVQSGCTLKRGTCLWWHDGHHVMPNYVKDYRLLTREEMDAKEFNYAYGCEFTTVHVDQELYLRWLLKQIRQNGGHLIFDTTYSMQELYSKYDVVVNCVGKRCRELLADCNQHRIKGSMLQTTNLLSEDRFFTTQDKIYICPNQRTGLCDIGFIWDKDNPYTEVDEYYQWLLLYRATQFVPEVKNCEIVKSWTEKRPQRIPILLEMEHLDCGGPILPVVHNIGHGENTISLAWGRGVHAARLVQEFQRTSKPFARRWMPFFRL